MTELHTASAVALLAFLVMATVDGVYLHLWRYRLHARPASRREHRLHTASAVLFAATLPTVFVWETAGVLLWLGVLLIGLDLAVAVVDMWSEQDSRADLGGLSRGEYVLHMLIMSARGAAIALSLGARPATAWALDAPWVLGPLPSFAALVGSQAMPGAVLMAALHLWLCSSSGARTLEAIRSRARCTPIGSCSLGCCTPRASQGARGSM